jgi:hypothetical protein
VFKCVCECVCNMCVCVCVRVRVCSRACAWCPPGQAPKLPLPPPQVRGSRLCRDVAAGARGVGAAAQPRDARVDDRHAHLQGRQDVGQGLAVGVVLRGAARGACRVHVGACVRVCVCVCVCVCVRARARARVCAHGASFSIGQAHANRHARWAAAAAGAAARAGRGRTMWAARCSMGTSFATAWGWGWRVQALQLCAA